MSKSVKDKIKGAQLPTTTEAICLRADLVAQHQDLQRQLDEMQVARGDMLNSPSAERRQLAEQIKAVETEMAEDTIVFHLRAVSRSAWRDLIIAHPQRDGVDADRMLGLNGDTFWPALLRVSVYEPELDDDDWAALLGDDALTDKQFERLCVAAWALNRGEVSIPFSSAASAILHGSGSEPRRPSDSASAPDDSTAGNRRPSPSTSTTTPAG